MTNAPLDIEQVIDFVRQQTGVDDTAAASVVDGFVTSTERLLDEHRRLLAEELFAEAERFTKGGFADGIRHAATTLLHPRPEASARDDG